MKLSTKGRYGLRALVDLAANDAEGTVSLAQIAQRQKLSLNYLEQVFGMLRRAGIIIGVKGSNGGFRLAGDMEKITVREVLEALEGEFSIVDRTGEEEQDMVQAALRTLLWDEIDRKVNLFLEEKTLGSLVREYRRNLEKGTIEGIVIPAERGIFRFLGGKEEDCIIKWDRIRTIGDDVVLVDVDVLDEINYR